MNGFRTLSAALLGLALAAAATPALAKHKTTMHPGYAARAQAMPGEAGGPITSGPRANALRECNDKAAPLRDYTWGQEQDFSYRACMSQHGQPE